MTNYKVVINGEKVVFSVFNKQLVSDYDPESEFIAFKLSHEISPAMIFLVGAQTLLKATNERNFLQQCNFMQIQIKNIRNLHSDSIGYLGKANSHLGDLCFLYLGLNSKSAAERRGAVTMISNPLLLAFLATVPYEELRNGVATNSNASKATLNKLSTDESILVRMDVASNLNTDINTLKRLAEEDELRGMVLNHPKADEELLAKYINDPNISIRGVVARNIRNADLLAELTQDPDGWVRKSLLDNGFLPQEILQHLTNDSVFLVANQARERLQREEKSAENNLGLTL